MTTLYKSHPDSQYQDSNTTSVTPHANADGWILYYSPEGYPYYYNEITGESQWAENEEEIAEVEHVDTYDTLNEEYSLEKPSSERRVNHYEYQDENDEDIEQSDNDDDSEITSSTEVSTSATGTEDEEDDGFNAEFQAYLESPEGQRELMEEKMTIEKYQNQVNSKRKSSKSSRGRKYEDTDPSAGTEVDDIAPQNTAADERYNPYQQQSYQEQFLQQKRQQQYEYEKYEYENQQKRLEQYEDDSSFARTYGLPSPPTHNKYQHTGPYRSSVRFQDYPDDYDNYLDTMKSNKNARKYGKKNIDDELEGGDYRDYSEHSRAGSDENDEEEEESDSDVSVSSDDSDVQILREPLLPSWLSWTKISRLVDTTIRDPVLNTSSKLFHAIIPVPVSASTRVVDCSKAIDYDEEGGSGSNDDNDDNDDFDTGNSEGYRPSESSDVSQSKSRKRIKNIPHSPTTAPYTLTSFYANMSHYLSLSTLTTLFTTQQKEWLQETYASTSVAVWNFVTNSAEYMVDGQPVRRGLDDREQSQPLPP